jgi:hypothetical protein
MASFPQQTVEFQGGDCDFKNGHSVLEKIQLDKAARYGVLKTFTVKPELEF